MSDIGMFNAVNACLKRSGDSIEVPVTAVMLSVIFLAFR